MNCKVTISAKVFGRAQYTALYNYLNQYWSELFLEIDWQGTVGTVTIECEDLNILPDVVKGIDTFLAGWIACDTARNN